MPNKKKNIAQPHAGPINPKEPLVRKPVNTPGSDASNPNEPGTQTGTQTAQSQFMPPPSAQFHAVSAGPINPKEPL